MKQESLPLEISVCMGSSCFSRGNVDLIRQLQSVIEKNNLTNKVLLRGNLCENICEKGPNMKISGHRCECTEKNLETCLQKLSETFDIPLETLRNSI